MHKRSSKRTIVNLALDSLIFVAFLVATAPQFTGRAIHEWLSIAFGAALITHLLLHWSWITKVTAHFFRNITWASRLNYLLNVLLFIGMTVILFTGLMISEEVLPLFGLHFQRDHLWLFLHRQATDFTVLVLAMHVALHWRWIVNSLRRVTSFSLRRPSPKLVSSAHTPTEVH